VTRHRYLTAFFFGTLAVSPAVAQTVAAPGSPESSSAPAPPPPSAFVTATDPYAAKGLPLGGFRLYPTIEINGDYDTNVYLTETNPKDDFFTRETPQAMLHSDWSRHELDVYAAGSFYQYVNLPLQDHIDWDAGADGRLDIYQGVSLSGSGSYSAEHLANSSPDQSTSAKSPTPFSIAQSNATLSYNPYHFGFYLGGGFSRFDYEPSKLIGGGLADNSDRNEDSYTGFAKASYEFSPGYAVFVQGNSNLDHYDLALDRSGVDRNNQGYSANAGVDMLITTLIRGQLFAGYLDQRFKGPFGDVAGINFGANVDWAVSSLWTVHFVASRSLNGTILANASTEDDKTGQLSVDYRVQSNITITGSAMYLNAAFDGADRTDQYFEPRIQVTYHMNPWIGIELSDTYQRRVSTTVGQNFDDNIAYLGLKFQE
jgi:hypothetical protein